MNPEKIVENIRRELSNYLTKYPNLKSIVIGVSGGIDSALCCALARPVCDEMGVRLIGRSLPIVSNGQDEIDRARIVGKAFCHDFKEIVLDGTYMNLRSDIILSNGVDLCTTEDDIIRAKIRMGNVKARIRMIYLYDLAQKERGLVLSTDNYTEQLLGFWSLHADVGDLGMIQSCWKTEVYEIASYLAAEYIQGKSYDLRADALEQCIKCKATDGLGVADGDLDQFGAESYTDVDDILQRWLKDKPDSLKNNSVVIRHENTHWKRNNPFNFPRYVVAD